jgi:hypothetical protein
MTFQTPGQDFPLFPNSGRYKKVKDTQDDKDTKGTKGTKDTKDTDSDNDDDEDIDDKVTPKAKAKAKATDKPIPMFSTPDNLGPFENMFDAETNETLRLLKITCRLLLDKFKDILVDAERAERKAAEVKANRT